MLLHYGTSRKCVQHWARCEPNGPCIATLRRWDMEGVFLARKDRRGRRVYNGADLVELRELAATRKAGRKRKKPTGA